MVYSTIAGIFILAIVGGVGMGVASADSIDDVARSGAFGFSKETHEATVSVDVAASAESESSAVLLERSTLAAATPRELGAGMRMIDDMERAEQERIAA